MNEPRTPFDWSLFIVGALLLIVPLTVLVGTIARSILFGDPSLD